MIIVTIYEDTDLQLMSHLTSINVPQSFTAPVVLR